MECGERRGSRLGAVGLANEEREGRKAGRQERASNGEKNGRGRRRAGRRGGYDEREAMEGRKEGRCMVPPSLTSPAAADVSPSTIAAAVAVRERQAGRQAAAGPAAAAAAAQRDR